MASAIDCIGMACNDASCNFRPVRFRRRAVGDHDVLIDMKYCGVCHSDVVWLKSESPMIMGTPAFPDAMPGHELAGVVAAVGKSVTKFQVGDQVGVGCMVDSCLKCSNCRRGSENWCRKLPVMTYGGKDRFGRAGIADGSRQTKGGYCNKFVVHEHFAIKVPSSYPLEAAGPIMCAGITVYDPMRQHGVGAGTRVGVVGLGGLGVTAIKIAKALGALVTGISRGEAKRQLALDAGATDYIATADASQLQGGAGSLDLIINTIPTNHDYKVYSPLLGQTGKQVLLGLTNAQMAAFALSGVTGGHCRVEMSGIGGVPATQEVMDLVAKHSIIPHTKVCPVSELNQIFEACDSGNDAGIRYVLDIGNSLTEEAFDTIACGDAPRLAEHAQGFSLGGVAAEAASMLWHETLCKKRGQAADKCQ